MTDLPTTFTGVAATLAGRCLAAANCCYEITTPGAFHSRGRWFEAAGWRDLPTAVVGGPKNINAALVGETDDGVIVAFRGTVAPDDETKSFEERLRDWIQDAECRLVPIPGEAKGLCHEGFLNAWDTLRETIDSLIPAGVTTPIIFAGHSKGAGCARLAAVDECCAIGRQAIVVTFGAPRVFDAEGASFYATLPIADTRFSAAGDVVPHTPLSIHGVELLREVLPDLPSFDYADAGNLKFIETDGRIVPASIGEHLDDLMEVATLLKNREFSAIRARHGIGFGSLYARAVCPEVTE